MAPSAISPPVQQTAELTATAVEKKIAQTAASPLSQSKYESLCFAIQLIEVRKSHFMTLLSPQIS